MNLPDQILASLTQAVSEHFPTYQGKIELRMPPNPAYGDFTTHAALAISKELNQLPTDIAPVLQHALLTLNGVEQVEIVPPGFLNIFVRPEFFVNRTITDALTLNQQPLQPSGPKIIVEHTSVNPNKAMHIAHIRNAAIGDTIARLYRRLGHQIEVQNYIDDTGVQVADTTMALQQLHQTQPAGQHFDDFAWDLYVEINKLYEVQPELIEQRKQISHAIEQGDNTTAHEAAAVVDKILTDHLALLARFGITYDLLTFESDIIKCGFWDHAFELLKQSPNFFLATEGEQAGCWILRSVDGAFPDKIFVRSDGTKVYTAKDTAYHMWKFGLLDQDFHYLRWPVDYLGHELWRTAVAGEERSNFGQAKKIVNVIDERQSYPQEAVRQALRSLGYQTASDNYVHLAYGVVTLSPETAQQLGVDTTEDKQSYAMSGRKGSGVKARDLLEFLMKKIEATQAASDIPAGERASSESIAAAAIKYYMIKSNPASSLVFDYEQALALTGNTGPYLQYSHVRAAGILRSGGEFTATTNKGEPLSDTELTLIRRISEWPLVLRAAGESLALSSIADYAFRLSSDFHRFYETSPVLKTDEPIKSFRLTLTQAYQRTIQDVLSVLGIAAPERM